MASTNEPLLGILAQTGNGSVLRNATFSLANELLFEGTQRQLNHIDMLSVPAEMSPPSCSQYLRLLWDKELKESENIGKPPSLTRVLQKAYISRFIKIGVLKAVNDSLAFVGPLLLHELLTFLDDSELSTNLNRGYLCAVALGSTAAIRAFLGTMYTFQISKMSLEIRASITTLIFRKTLSRSTTALTMSSGEVQTLMSVDCDRVVNLCGSLHDLWSLPLQIVAALTLLFFQVKFAFLGGLFIVLLLIPMNRWLSIRISKSSREMMTHKDSRVQVTSEVLSKIHQIKMMAWEPIFAQKIDCERLKEVKCLSSLKYLDALCVYSWACTQVLFSVATFSILSLHLFGDTTPITAAVIFTSLSLFGVLLAPLNSFPWVINGIIEASVSLGRLLRFLDAPDLEGAMFLVSESEAAICLREASFGWGERGSVTGPVEPILKGINLELPLGSLTVVLGEVGSGKSSLLAALIGELALVSGQVAVCGQATWTGQEPWIFSGSVRENILFGSAMDSGRYRSVLQQCALEEDLNRMPGGDLSLVGEGGFLLSGGQRARVSLARALYSSCSVLLLDDPLSSLDADVAGHVIRHALCGPLAAFRTRVIATHNTEALEFADLAIVLSGGRVAYAGLAAGAPGLRQVSGHDRGFLKQRGEASDDRCLGEDSPAELPEEEFREVGSVKAGVYLSYLEAIGWVTVAIVLGSTLLMQASRNGSDLWLSHWLDADQSEDSKAFGANYFVIVLISFGVFNSIFTLARAFSFAFAGIEAAKKLHHGLLRSVLSSAIEFFYQTPTGRILNRFSSDQYTVDDSLPFISNILLAHSFSLSAILVVLVFLDWAVVAILVPVGVLYFCIQKRYRATARELRRLDSQSRSPIYSLFSEILSGNGVSTIRAFGAQETFARRNERQVALNQAAGFSELVVAQWLALRLQLLAAAVVLFVGVVAVAQRQFSLPNSTHEHSPSMTAGVVGLCLSYALPIVSLLNDLLTCFSETEKEMIAVERINEYSRLQPESEPASVHGVTSALPDWPHTGSITFSNVSFSYRAGLPLVLNGLSFFIPGGSKVAIAGRTGAGKSTIFNLLFRLHPLNEGSILIDDLDIARIPLTVLRSRMTVIPQSPFLFKGTVRDNLDPSGSLSDSAIWEGIRCFSMEAFISKIGGLEATVLESGGGLSMGEKQLICLVRALLQKPRILCLDESTANIDTQSSLIVQQTLAKFCSHVTVLTIAHRVETICSSSRALVMDGGRISADGDPNELFQKGVFQKNGF